MKPGKVLDVGCAARLNYLPAALVSLGWEVWGIDLREWKFRFPNFHFVRGDIRCTNFPDNFFDAVYAISTLEHIGLSGRYGVIKDDPEGDIKAVKEIARILRVGGSFLFTVPYAKDFKIFKSLGARVYDERRLAKLLAGWQIKDKIFYVQDKEGLWLMMTEEGQLESTKGKMLLLEATLWKTSKEGS